MLLCADAASIATTPAMTIFELAKLAHGKTMRATLPAFLVAASALLLPLTTCAATAAGDCAAPPLAAKVLWGPTEEVLWRQICNSDHTGLLQVDGAHATVDGQFLADILLNEQLASSLPRNGLVLDNIGFSGDVDLGYGTVHVPLEIRKSNFAGDIRLNNATFMGHFQIKYSNITKRFFAPGAKFKTKLTMTDNKIRANLNLTGSDIAGDVTDLDRNKVDTLLMNGSRIHGESPCCTDRPRWRRGAGRGRGAALPPSPDLRRAVQGQRRSPPPHPQAAAPGHQLGGI
jgi:hypothetical protein